jgi:hypothetical protein
VALVVLAGVGGVLLDGGVVLGGGVLLDAGAVGAGLDEACVGEAAFVGEVAGVAGRGFA